jgi:hypothetical protein
VVQAGQVENPQLAVAAKVWPYDITSLMVRAGLNAVLTASRYELAF